MNDPIEKQKFSSSSDSPKYQNTHSISEQVEKQEANAENDASTHTATASIENSAEEFKNEDPTNITNTINDHRGIVPDPSIGWFFKISLNRHFIIYK